MLLTPETSISKMIYSSLITKYKIILPHEKEKFINSKETIKNSDVVIAEVSYPSTGLGIELGWANILEVPIIFIYKRDSKLSSSLKILSGNFIEYQDSTELIEKLITVLSRMQK